MKQIPQMPDAPTTGILADLAQTVEAELPALEALRYRITLKADDSPVTEADTHLERLIGRHLAERLPGLRVIGEESYAPGLDDDLSGWIAVVDPIDGTENFCSGLAEWGVSVSLWRDGAHAGSMLHMPELGRRMVSGDPVRQVPASRIVGFSSSMSQALFDDMRGVPELRVMGCAVYNLYNVIRGSFSRFSNHKGAKSWDLIAGLNLALDAGCKVEVEGQDYAGQYLKADRKYRFNIRHQYDRDPGQGAVG